MIDTKVAVILIGGRSRRMGVDKSLLCYHQLSQREHLGRLFTSLGFTTLFSGREEQRDDEQHFVIDEFEDFGPASGIVSALKYMHKSRQNNSFDRHSDWLFVSSCDQPSLNVKIIDYLWRNSQSMVNLGALMHCYRDEINLHRIEPFPSVWHSKAIKYIERKLAVAGDTKNWALQDILPRQEVAIYPCPDYQKLININSAKQRQAWIVGKR